MSYLAAPRESDLTPFTTHHLKACSSPLSYPQLQSIAHCKGLCTHDYRHLALVSKAMYMFFPICKHILGSWGGTQHCCLSAPDKKPYRPQKEAQNYWTTKSMVLVPRVWCRMEGMGPPRSHLLSTWILYPMKKSTAKGGPELGPLNHMA